MLTVYICAKPQRGLGSGTLHAVQLRVKKKLPPWSPKKCREMSPQTQTAVACCSLMARNNTATFPPPSTFPPHPPSLPHHMWESMMIWRIQYKCPPWAYPWFAEMFVCCCYILQMRLITLPGKDFFAELFSLYLIHFLIMSHIFTVPVEPSDTYELDINGWSAVFHPL